MAIMEKLYDKNISVSDNTTAGKILNYIGYDKKVLEVGCASGVQTKLLREVFRCHVTGVELNPSSAEKARCYCDSLIVGDIELLSFDEVFSGKQFDVILLADVLEHLRCPEATLKKLAPLLMDENSYIVISIPNVVHASIVYNMMHGIFQYLEYGLLDDTHIKFFTRQGIVDIIKDSGFAVTSIKRVLCKPLDTEIKLELKCLSDYRAMKYILKSNSESLVYQYVIKAHKRDSTDPLMACVDYAEDVCEMHKLSRSLIKKYSFISFMFSAVLRRLKEAFKCAIMC